MLLLRIVQDARSLRTACEAGVFLRITRPRSRCEDRLRVREVVGVRQRSPTVYPTRSRARFESRLRVRGAVGWRQELLPVNLTRPRARSESRLWFREVVGVRQRSPTVYPTRPRARFESRLRDRVFGRLTRCRVRPEVAQLRLSLLESAPN